MISFLKNLFLKKKEEEFEYVFEIPASRIAHLFETKTEKQKKKEQEEKEKQEAIRFFQSLLKENKPPVSRKPSSYEIGWKEFEDE